MTYSIKRLALLTLAIIGFCFTSWGQTFEVVNQSGHGSKYYQYPRVTKIQFSSDSKYIVTGGNAGTTTIWDIASGRKVRSFGNEFRAIDAIDLTDDLQTLSVYPSYNSTPKIYDVMSGKIKSIMPYHKGRITHYNSLIKYYGDKDEVLTVSGNQLMLYDAKTWEVIKSLPNPEKKRHSKSAISKKGDLIAFGYNNGDVSVYSYPELELVAKLPSFGGSVYAVKFSKDGNMLVTAGRNSTAKIRVFDCMDGFKKINEVILEKGVKNLQFPVIGDLNVNHDGSQMVIVRNYNHFKPEYYLQLYDLSTMEIIHKFDEKMIYSQAISISPDDKFLAVGRNESSEQVTIYEIETGRRVKSFKMEAVPDKPSFVLKDDRLVIKAYKQYHTFELISGEKVKEGLRYGDNTLSAEEHFESEKYPSFPKMRYLRPQWGYTTATGRALSPSGNFAIQLGIIDNDNKSERSEIKDVASIVNCKTLETLPLKDTEQSTYRTEDIPAITDDGKYFFDFPYVYETQTMELVFTVPGGMLDSRLFNATFLHDNKTLLMAMQNNELRGYNVETGEQSMTFQDKTGVVVEMRVSSDGQEVFLLNMNASVHRFSIPDRKLLATYYPFAGEDYATVWNDGYYRKSPGSYDQMHFVSGMKVVGFEIFDLVFNRPDKILSASGFDDAKTLETYYQAYAKRVRRMGFKMDQISTEVNLPDVSIGDYTPPIRTNKAIIKVPVSIDGNGVQLDRINVYVNNVPLYGKRGKKLDQIMTYRDEIAIELSSGTNKVEISAHNTSGFESPRVLFSILNEAVVKPNLYIVAFGVSEFKQSEYNLTYAAKDAKDVIHAFSNHDEAFDNVFVTELTNQFATSDNVKAVKETLAKSKVNDLVIVFVASHGVVGDNFSYFLATHDMDFANPEDKGLAYQDLEDILDGISARNKIMFLDACHSGELDSDDLVVQSNETASNSIATVNSRGFKIIAKKVSANGSALTSSFDLMKELFSDIRRGTGAIVISAAAGQEFAYESAEWNNGVFTYAMLEGLQTKKANTDRGKYITVIELKDYLSKKVQVLTDGKQHPTSRTENLENDFVVW